MKEQFIGIYQRYIKRKGADKLLKWLVVDSDFFTAPASTRFHLAEEGGLCAHSVHVFERLKRLYVDEFWRDMPNLKEMENVGVERLLQMESVAVVGLLHDLCKVDMYELELKNKKVDGEWQQVPTYTHKDKFPFGHGEKSVYIINQFMSLTDDEAMAIRWHMGFSDMDFKAGGYSVGNAFGMSKLAVLAHMADLSATYLDE